MNRKKLRKIQREVADLRRSSPRASEIQSIATQLGRQMVNWGKEPTWVNLEFPELRPFSIPAHGGKDLSTGVKFSLLNQIEDDINAWDERLSQEEDKEGNDE